MRPAAPSPMHDDALLAGEVSPWPSKAGMADILRAAGLSVTMGRYAIRVDDCECFAFQAYGGDLGEPMIQASAETLERLLQDATRVSLALAAAGLRHRFEVYDGGERLAGYLHHDWPAPSA